MTWETKTGSLTKRQLVYLLVFLLVGMLIESRFMEARGYSDSSIWFTLVVQGLFFLFMAGFWSMGFLPVSSRFFESEGDHLSFGGFMGTATTCRVADIDSLSIRDGSIRICVYRPGVVGDEFAVVSGEMPPEKWADLTGLCRKIEAAMKLGVGETASVA